MEPIPADWSWKERIQYFLFLLLLHILGAFPVPAIVRISRLLYRLLHPLARRRKEIVFQNLDYVYGNRLSPGKKQTIAFQCFAQLIEASLILLKCTFLNSREAIRLNTFVNREILDREIADGNGVILVGAHSSNFCYGIGLLRYCGYPVNVAIRPLKSRPAERIMNLLRSKPGIQSFDQETQTLNLVRSIKKGEILWVALDQNARTTILVDFLGHPATTFEGPVKLAYKFGLSIVPAFTHRTGPGSYEMHIKEPIRVQKKKDPTQKEIRATLQEAVGAIEKQIMTYPEEWFWFHRRWRTGKKLCKEHKKGLSLSR